MLSRIGYISWNARASCREQADIALLVGRGELFRRRPVVGDFVVIPLHEDGHFGVEGADVLVHEIVLVGGAEFVERLGHLGFFFDGDVLPHLAVGKLHLGLDRAVGIDGVAGMQQEIRAMLAHGGEGEHAAVIGVYAPALSGDIAAPDETDVASIGWRGAEAADDSLALDVDMREIAKPDAVENILTRGQVFQQHLCGEVAFGQRCDRRQRPGVGERFGR